MFKNIYNYLIIIGNQWSVSSSSSFFTSKWDYFRMDGFQMMFENKHQMHVNWWFWWDWTNKHLDYGCATKPDYDRKCDFILFGS